MQMSCIAIQISTYPMLTYLNWCIAFCADALMLIIIIIIIIIILVVYMTFNLDNVCIY